VTRRTAAAIASTAVLLAVCCASASAAQHASIDAGFRPERLGHATTVSFAFQIDGEDTAPAALTALSLVYPHNLGFATSGLGLAACQRVALETVGPSVCPANSMMGSGDATVEVPIGPELVKEGVTLTVFAGPSPDGYLHMLIYVNGIFPVSAQVVLSGVLLPGHISIVLPPIPSLPEAPYVSVANLHLTLGGDLVYYERVAGRSVPYRPPGVGLPRTCPHKGFAFAATFKFLNGSRAGARTAVPCPHHR
jgi:hypothetical protein